MGITEEYYLDFRANITKCARWGLSIAMGQMAAI